MDSGIGIERWNDCSRWGRFWHQPVRAERLAILRIAFAAALFAEQLVQYLPRLDFFFGPNGVAPAGLNDAYLRNAWRWTILLFSTDDMSIVRAVFFLWMAATVGLMIGWKTRWMAVGSWLGLLAFINRNPHLDNGGDDLAKIAFFLLIFAPCAGALSVDHWLKRRTSRSRETTATTHDRESSRLVEPWAVRLFQLELVTIYCTSGLHKLQGDTWWNGLSMYNFMNDVTMVRWSTAQFALPFWMTAIATFAVVWWEVLFPLLVAFRFSRAIALWMGVLMHVGIFTVIDVGWFAFYSICMYGCWIPDRCWRRWFGQASVEMDRRQTSGAAKSVDDRAEERILELAVALESELRDAASSEETMPSFEERPSEAPSPKT